jgi:hypothetical protein
LPSTEDSLKAVDGLFALRHDPRIHDHDKLAWHRETHVAMCEYGQPDTREKLADLQEQLLPALVKGLVVSAADCERRVWYALTQSGVRVAEERTRRPSTQPTKPVAEMDSTDQVFYRQQAEREKAALRSGEPSNTSDIGMVPMPVAAPTRGMIAARPA